MADIGARAREVSAGVVRVLERISLEPLEKQQVSASSSDVPLVPSNSSEPTLPCSASGVTVYAGSVNASSSRVAPQPANDNSHGDALEKVRSCSQEGYNGDSEGILACGLHWASQQWEWLDMGLIYWAVGQHNVFLLRGGHLVGVLVSSLSRLPLFWTSAKTWICTLKAVQRWFSGFFGGNWTNFCDVTLCKQLHRIDRSPSKVHD
jgi:hypothetical protein